MKLPRWLSALLSDGDPPPPMPEGTQMLFSPGYREALDEVSERFRDRVRDRALARARRHGRNVVRGEDVWAVLDDVLVPEDEERTE